MTALKDRLAESEIEILSLEYRLLGIDRLGDASKSDRRKSLNLQDEKSEEANHYRVARDSLERGLYLGAGYALTREAYRLFLLGARDTDCPKCWWGIGFCLYNGYGVECDVRRGEEILAEALPKIEALADDCEAYVILHEYYERGYTVPCDHSKALSYLKRADCPRGHYLLAGFMDDPVPLLEKAIEEGFPLSYYALGNLYRHGNYGSMKKPIKPNIEKATEYYVQGAQLGYPGCRISLSELKYAKEGLEIENGVLLSCALHISELHIPKEVTKISSGAFHNARIETLYLPDSVDMLPDDAFDKKHIPKIVSSRINGAAYKARVAAKDATAMAGEALSNTRAGISAFFDKRSHLAWNLISVALIAVLALIPQLLPSVLLRYPNTLSLVCYIAGAVISVGAIVYLICDNWDYKILYWDKGGILFFAPIIALATSVLGIFYGGFIPDKWAFIPIAIVVTLISVAVSFAFFCEKESYSIFNLPVSLGGVAVIVGGIICGAFSFSAPSVILIILYGCQLLVPFGIAIYGLAEDYESGWYLLCSPIILLSLSGVCFSGGFVWWGHVIAFLPLIALLISLVAELLDNLSSTGVANTLFAIFLVATSVAFTILTTTGVMEFVFPKVVSIIFYAIPALVALIAVFAFFSEEEFGLGILSGAVLMLFLSGIFFGGVIPDKWSFIPISAEIIAILLIVAFIVFEDNDSYSTFNLPISLGGIAVMVGGLISGAFTPYMPSVALIVIYACQLLIPLGFAIYGFSESYEPGYLLCSPVILLSAIGLCFSGCFAWWGHAILLLPVIFMLIAFVAFIIDEYF